MPALVGYMLLFVLVGIGFILIHLVMGKLIRPAKPEAEKLTIYECGEPTIGSAWVQFDLRFYVVALLFVIFDVEVAFFFPWAIVFGRLNQLANPNLPAADRAALTVGAAPGTGTQSGLVPAYPETAQQRALFRQVVEAGPDAAPVVRQNQQTYVNNNMRAAHQLGWIAFVDILVFFGVLLVGFAYLWRRGDLDWVRSTAAERAAEAKEASVKQPAEKVLVGAGRGL